MRMRNYDVEGRAAGEYAAKTMRAKCTGKSAEIFAAFINNTIAAKEDACKKMLSEGASPDEVLVWITAFDAAVTPVVIELTDAGKRRDAAQAAIDKVWPYKKPRQ